MRVISSIAILLGLFTFVNGLADSDVETESLNLPPGPVNPDPSQSNAENADPATDMYFDEDAKKIAFTLPPTPSTDTTYKNGDVLSEEQIIDAPISSVPNCPPDRKSRRQLDLNCPSDFQTQESPEKGAGGGGGINGGTVTNTGGRPRGKKTTFSAPTANWEICSDKQGGRSRSRIPMCHDGINGVIPITTSTAVNLNGGFFCKSFTFSMLILAPKNIRADIINKQ